MLDQREVKALFVEHIDQLLGHFDERVDDCFLLCKAPLKFVVLQNVPQFVSNQSLTHQTRHTRLHLCKLLLVIKHVALADCRSCESILLQHFNLIEFYQLEQAKFWPGRLSWFTHFIINLYSFLRFCFFLAHLLFSSDLFV